MAARKLLLLVAFALLGDFANAQMLDGFYVKQHNYTKQVIPQPSVREADVLWSKRVWRRIDVRQKLNHQLYFPLDEIKDRQCLYTVINRNLRDGLVSLYEEETPGTCEFTKPIDPSKIEAVFGYTQTKEEQDEITGDITKVDVDVAFTPAMLSFIDLKEDWYFDKEKSELRVQVIGLSLIFSYLDETGSVKKKQPGWLYFPELQYVLANYETYNISGNDSERRSFLDVFLKRQFSSYITKESNVYDRYIQDYKVEGLGQLAESERIKGEMFRFEHDLWSY
ncbi:MAG: gliding motility associated protein GldN [Sphingobacteriales bacterium]|jgi:gliding motility associated protien GldN